MGLDIFGHLERFGARRTQERMHALAPVTRWLVLAFVSAVVFFAPGCRKAPPPSFILISLDTTRADHLGAYGYGRETTPFLDELAQRGFVFEQAVALSQNTLISHASLLTGLSSVAHGATPHEGGYQKGHGDVGGRAIAPGFTTLAEDLASHGYRTGAFLAHADWLNVKFGFDQGFEAFTSKYRSADQVLGQARRWLSRESPEAPYFLFLHLYDVHSDWGDRPYDAPDAFRGRFAKEDFDVKGKKASNYLGAVNGGKIGITPAEVEVLRDQYDEGLAYTDHRLDVFFDSLDSEWLRRTWILVVADHGEGFLEHGKLLHATFHDEIVHVPFLIVPPPDSEWETPVRVAEQVRLIDVRPTVVSLAGLPAPPDVGGVDLTPCMRSGDNCRPQPATLHANGLRFDGWKLILSAKGPLLYELEKDPREQNDLASRPAMKKRIQNMRAMLGDLVRQQEAMQERILQGTESLPVEMDPEAEERLKALGYVQ